MTKLLCAPALAILLACASTSGAAPPLEPAPPPRAAPAAATAGRPRTEDEPMTAAEAEEAATKLCKQLQYFCLVRGVELSGGQWHVYLDAARKRRAGALRFDYDIATRALVKADEPPAEPVRPMGPPGTSDETAGGGEAHDAK